MFLSDVSAVCPDQNLENGLSGGTLCDFLVGGMPKPSSESRGAFGVSFGGHSVEESIPCEDGGVPTTCSNSSGGGVVTVSTFLGGLPELSLEEVGLGSSAPEELGGGSFFWGFSGGSLSVR